MLKQPSLRGEANIPVVVTGRYDTVGLTFDLVRFQPPLGGEQHEHRVRELALAGDPLMGGTDRLGHLGLNGRGSLLS